LSSIAGQSYKNIEIVIVNDGSTDGSLEVASDFAKQDSRVKIISQENYGVAAARNKGVINSSGDYFIHADSDDMLPVNAIAILCASAVINDADIVIGDYIIKKNGIQKRINLNFSGNKDTLLRGILTGDYHASLWNKLIKRKLYGIASIEPGIDFTEDKLFISRVLLRSENLTINYVAQPVYIYRRRENSYTTRFSKKSLQDQTKVVEIICGELCEKFDKDFLDHLKRKNEVSVILNFSRSPESKMLLKDILSDNDISITKRIACILVLMRITFPVTIAKLTKAWIASWRY